MAYEVIGPLTNTEKRAIVGERHRIDTEIQKRKDILLSLEGSIRKTRQTITAMEEERRMGIIHVIRDRDVELGARSFDLRDNQNGTISIVLTDPLPAAMKEKDKE